MENGKIIRFMFVNNSIICTTRRQYIINSMDTINNIQSQNHRAKLQNKQMSRRKKRRKLGKSQRKTKRKKSTNIMKIQHIYPNIRLHWRWQLLLHC